MATSAKRMSTAIMAVDPRLPTPLYHQIYLILREQIGEGSFGSDATVPGEQELARLYSVSRITAKRALDELAAAGLVVRERGRGTRVRSAPPAPPVRAPIEGLLENLLAMGLKTKVVLLEFGYVAAPADAAAALGCAIGQTVQRSVRVRRIDGAPFSHLTTFVPEAIGRTYSRRDLASRPLLSLLEQSGVRVSRADQAISAKLADAQVARRLLVEVGSALLKITRIVRDQRGHPVEYITGLYRPDRHQYAMSLSRVQDRGQALWQDDPGPRRGAETAKRKRES